MTTLKIYTDGGCRGNQSKKNVGGWGALLIFGKHSKELYGNAIDTTNNRMEMTALLEALRAIKKENQTIEVYSDSSYLMDCFRKKWYRNWQRNGWKTAQKKPVENKDLWEAILPYLDRHSISFYRIKGHVHIDAPSTNLQELYEKFIEWNGDSFSYDDFIFATEMNVEADRLANKGMDEA